MCVYQCGSGDIDNKFFGLVVDKGSNGRNKVNMTSIYRFRSPSSFTTNNSLTSLSWVNGSVLMSTNANGTLKFWEPTLEVKSA